MPLYHSILASRLTYAAMIADPFHDRGDVARTVFNGLNNVDRLAFGRHTSLRRDLLLALAEPKEAEMLAIFREAGRPLPGTPCEDTEPKDYGDSFMDSMPDKLLVLVPLAALLLTSCRCEPLSGAQCLTIALTVAAVCLIAGVLSWLTERRE